MPTRRGSATKAVVNSVSLLSRPLRDGIRRLDDGREICIDEKAWKERRKAVWKTSDRRCECCDDCSWHQGYKCNRLLALDEKMAEETGLAVAHIDHIVPRGLGGGLRDDRKSNLRAYCPRCHGRRHAG